MPTYDYECTSCGHTFERFQNITAEPLKNCPLCSQAVKRLIGGGAGIIFKGSGFYCTDFKDKKGTPPGKKEGEKKQTAEKKVSSESPKQTADKNSNKTSSVKK